MRLLVTDGAGFIGSNLCRRLVGEAHEALCVDNYSSGRRANVAPFTGHPRFGAMRHDVTCPLYVKLDPADILGSPAIPVFPPDDPHRRQPALARACAAIGWAPLMRLREGIARTVAFSSEAPANCAA
jgi:UDP-glucuronate decarboxylase